VRVNALIPGLIDTALTRHEGRYAQALRVGGTEPTGDEATDERSAEKALSGKLPLRRPWLEPESVAPAVVFLASDAAALVSGTSFAVTGGDSANVTA